MQQNKKIIIITNNWSIRKKVNRYDLSTYLIVYFLMLALIFFPDIKEFIYLVSIIYFIIIFFL